VNKAIPVYIPVNTLSSYQTAQYWSEFTNFIERNYQYIDTTVCDGNTYNFNGTILDSAGIYFNDSVVLTINITPTPNVPYDLSVYNITMNYVTISWQGDADSYDIYRNDTLIVNVTDTIYVDNFSMQQGPTYHYNIKAINNTGCESALSDTVWFAIIGVEDINIENTNIQAKLYPNPTNDKSTLEIEGLTSEADVLVYDMIGRVIQTYKINQGTKALEIDLSTYAKGVYSIRIVNESINQTKKLVVQ
ncbi:MAG: T9SS type A sorting domain-containing protein, partial [Bacteroidales bacterium]|nr:T9SS type A sorting domain-containing protein [Bacteroidales bacterium]